MSLIVGSTAANKVYVGTTAARGVYIGSTQVWPATTPVTPPATDTIASVAGLAARWRADAITGLANGALVTMWPDMTTNAYTATATSPRQPTWIAAGIGGKPVVRFDGSRNLLSNAPAGGSQQTIIAVMSAPTTDRISTIRAGSGPGALHWRVDGNALQMLNQWTGNIGYSSPTAIVAASLRVVVATYNAATGAYAYYVNGTAWGGGTSAQTLTARTTIIGSDHGPGDFFIGDIAELLVFSSVLSATDRATVTSALGSRYGITVAA